MLYDLMGKPLKVAGNLLADELYYWQWRNRVRLGERFKAICDERKTATKIVPPDFLMPILEAVGNVEDDDLQQLWANLLFSGMEDNSLRHPRFPQIPSALSSNDAKLFSFILDGLLNARYPSSVSGPGIPLRNPPPLGTWRLTALSLYNLTNLGLLLDYKSYPYMHADLDSYKHNENSRTVLGAPVCTVLGRDFAKAVMGVDVPTAIKKQLSE